MPDFSTKGHGERGRGAANTVAVLSVPFTSRHVHLLLRLAGDSV